jgi:putative membrane protein
MGGGSSRHRWKESTMPRYIVPDGPDVLHHGWLWPIGPLILLLFFVVIVGVAIWAVVRLSSRPVAGPPMPFAVPRGSGVDAALDLVRTRYARGEIGRDEFLQLSTDLGASLGSAWSSPAPPPAPPASPPASEST